MMEAHTGTTGFLLTDCTAYTLLPSAIVCRQRALCSCLSCFSLRRHPLFAAQGLQHLPTSAATNFLQQWPSSCLLWPGSTTVLHPHSPPPPASQVSYVWTIRRTFPPKIWEENGGASYSLKNTVYPYVGILYSSIIYRQRCVITEKSNIPRSIVCVQLCITYCL